MHRTKLNSVRRIPASDSLKPVLVSIGLTCALLAGSPATAQEELNRIVLRVNDEIRTLYDFEERKDSELSALLANPNLSPAERQEGIAKVSKDVAQQTLREMLLESFARQNGITVSERDVDDSVRSIQEQQGLNSTQELLSALEAAGMSLDMLRSNLRQEILFSSVVRREVTGKIEVTDDEKRAYYRNHPEQFMIPEERKLQEVIFLDASGTSSDELLAAAQRLQEAVSANGNLEQEIATYQDQGLSTGVIDLGWVKADDLEASLGEAAFSVPAGSYSNPTKAKGGFHIIFAEEIKQGFVRPYADVEALIENRERNQRFGPELRKFMTGLETGSHIVENLPPDAVGFRSLPETFDPDTELQNFRAPLIEKNETEGEEGSEASTASDT